MLYLHSEMVLVDTTTLAVLVAGLDLANVLEAVMHSQP